MGFHRFALGLRHWNCLCSALVMAWGSSNSCCHQCHQRDWPLDFWPALSHGHLDIIVDGKDLKRHLLFCPPPSSLRRLVRLRVSKQKIIHVHKHGLYREQFLHIETFTGEEETFTEKILHREAFKQSSSYTQKVVHREAFTQKLLHRGLCTEQVLHKEGLAQQPFTQEQLLHRGLWTEQLFHRAGFTHRSHYTNAFTHRSLYTQKF